MNKDQINQLTKNLDFFNAYLKQEASFLIDGYPKTIWNERNLNADLKTFPCELTLEQELRFFQENVVDEKLGILDKTWIFRVYSATDQREIDDPDHYSTTNLISLEIVVGIIKKGSGIFVYKFPSLHCTIGNIEEFFASCLKELNRDKSVDPDYIVYFHDDPAIVGDYYSESYDEVYFIGSLERALKMYQTNRSIRMGSGLVSFSYTYPVKFDPTSNLKVGDKKIIHPARQQTIDSEMDLYYENQGDDDSELNYEPDFDF